MSFEILYEDKNYILAEKPQGMPSQPDKTGDDDILTLCQAKTGIRDISVINRLDRPVGGIIILAKNKTAAAESSALVQNNAVEKEYTAVVCGKMEPDEGCLEDYLIKNAKLNTSSVSDKGNKNAKKAVLHYKVLKTVEDEEFGFLSLVKIKLETGRHHQIRVQFASRGKALWGDSKYNPSFVRRRGFFSVALWSSRTVFKDKFSKKIIEVQSTPKGEIFEKFKPYE